MSKKIKVDEFVTGNLSFSQINEAFELMHSGKRYILPLAMGLTGKKNQK
jgi:Zn-dependent alcohol dehydrogenase